MRIGAVSAGPYICCFLSLLPMHARNSLASVIPCGVWRARVGKMTIYAKKRLLRIMQDASQTRREASLFPNSLLRSPYALRRLPCMQPPRNCDVSLPTRASTHWIAVCTYVVCAYVGISETSVERATDSAVCVCEHVSYGG